MINQKTMKSKRAQITVFVILGLIIIITVSLLFYFKNSTIKIKPPVENLEVTDDVKPIQTYVIECLKSVSKEALFKIGQNGGYINITQLKISPHPYDSDALLFEPQTLPYWYHIRECKSSAIGCVDSFKPALCDELDDCIINSKGPNSIEEQLSRYIDSNIERCTDLSIFENEFEIQKGIPKTSTIIKEDYIDFTLDYPLEIMDKASKQKTNIPYFVTSHNVKLKEMYELATDITQSEADTNFLEHQTMNLVAIYSGLDSNKLPPLSKIELGTDIVTWTRTNVKEMLMNDVLVYMDFVRILGTQNYWQLMSTDSSDYSIYADGIYNSFEYNINNKTYDLETSFIYPYSDIYLDFGGSEILKPDEFVPDYPLMKAVGLFIKEYKFKYDISYPLVVKIKDNQAFNGEGYDFNYALEVNIRKNVPVRGNISVANLGGTGSLRLDSLTQKVNRTITIKTYDRHTKGALDEVNIYYSCGAEYLIGKTEMKNNEAILSAQFPFCQFGGQIIYEKSGYMSSAIDYNNLEGDDAKIFSFELWPSVEKNVEVLKRTPTNVNAIQKGGLGTFSIQATELSENDTAYISIKRIKESPYESDIPIVGFLTISSSGDITLNNVDEQKQQVLDLYSQGKIDQKTKDELLSELLQINNTVQVVESFEEIDVVPGKYVMDAFMIYKGSINIPKETRELCAGIKILGICTNKKNIELPEQHFTSWVNGGAKINFTLTENDVYGNKQKIVLYVLEQPLPVNWVTLEGYLSLEDYQKGKTNLLKPKLE